jgi:hypothetical protein
VSGLASAQTVSAVMTESRPFFRIVIGSYADAEEFWRAVSDLVRAGMQRSQICVIGAEGGTKGLTDALVPAPVRRTFSGCAFEIWSAELFDVLWRKVAPGEQPQADWMTAGQADRFWASLLKGEHVLVASAKSTEEMLRCSQVQLRHKPSQVQTFNFPMPA